MQTARVLLVVLLVAVPAAALDPGTVKGTFTINGKPVELKYAYAHLHDNKEGLLSRPRELRVLVTDREVPRESLQGILFLPVEEMAMQGQVQGLMFQLDPANPNAMVAVLLEKPAEAGLSLMRTTHSVTGSKLFKRWSFTPQRVVAEIDRRSEPNVNLPNLSAASFALEISAPVFNEPPVTADLRGKAAQTSPQAQLMAAAAKAMAAGDVEGVRKLQSVRGNRQFETAVKLQGVDPVQAVKQGGAELKGVANRIQRVVVRGERAVVLLGKDQWFTVVREGGKWKMDI